MIYFFVFEWSVSSWYLSVFVVCLNEVRIFRFFKSFSLLILTPTICYCHKNNSSIHHRFNIWWIPSCVVSHYCVQNRMIFILQPKEILNIIKIHLHKCDQVFFENNKVRIFLNKYFDNGGCFILIKIHFLLLLYFRLFISSFFFRFILLLCPWFSITFTFLFSCQSWRSIFVSYCVVS